MTDGVAARRHVYSRLRVPPKGPLAQHFINRANRQYAVATDEQNRCQTLAFPIVRSSYWH